MKKNSDFYIYFVKNYLLSYKYILYYRDAFWLFNFEYLVELKENIYW